MQSENLFRIWVHQAPDRPPPPPNLVVHQVLNEQGVDLATPFRWERYTQFLADDSEAPIAVMFRYVPYWLLNIAGAYEAIKADEEDRSNYPQQPTDPCRLISASLFQEVPGPIQLVLGPLPEPTPAFIPHLPNEWNRCRYCDLSLDYWINFVSNCSIRHLLVLRQECAAGRDVRPWLENGLYRRI